MTTLTHYRCRVQLHSDGSMHEVDVPIAFAVYGQTIVTLVQGKGGCYHATGFVVVILGAR